MFFLKMVVLYSIIFSILLIYSTAYVIPKEDSSTLELVHVLFRHGDRNPDEDSLWKSNPYYNESFYKEGYGQLTNPGKRTEYNLGLALRKRYDDFLGELWNINLLDVRTTDVNRTKMSVELVMAGLWSPVGSEVWWSPLNWQPIPYYYLPETEDKEINTYAACPRLYTEIDNVLAEDDIKKYFQDRYNETFDILSEHTGVEMTPFQAFDFYFGFFIQDQLNFTAENWTKSIYPEPLHSAAVDFYYIETNNTALRRISAGYFLRKVLADSAAKINNTLSPADRKMFVYSAHETNIATLLLSLEAYKITDIPPYGSHVLIEVHNINGTHGFKLFFQNNEQTDPIPIKLPNCDYFCPYDDFYEQVEEILPENDDIDCYGSNK